MAGDGLYNTASYFNLCYYSRRRPIDGAVVKLVAPLNGTLAPQI